MLAEGVNAGVSRSTTTTWLEAQEAVQQRSLRLGMVASCALHAGFGLFLAFEPTPEKITLPEVIKVTMVSLPNAAPGARRSAAAEPTPAEPMPAPAPAPAPAQKQVILPKRAAPASKKPKRKPKPKPMEYDDALAALRDELGEETPIDKPAPDALEVAMAEVAEEAEAAEGDGGAAEVDPVFAAWRLATRRHLRKVWVVPPDFREQGLVTGLTVSLSATGQVLGNPKVTQSSGNPYFDDNTVRALVRASPLPPPPKSGDWPFQFAADEGF